MLRLLLIAVAISVLAAPAAAQPPPEQPPVEGPDVGAPETPPPPPPPATPYEKHMQAGVALFQLENWDGAIAAFEAAYAEEKRPSPLINLALIYKKLARPAVAIEVLEQALRSHRDAMPPSQVAAAEREIQEMSPLLAHVTLTLAPAEAELFIDGRPQKGFKSGGVVALSPGSRRLRAVAFGYATHEGPFTVVTGRENKPIAIALEATHAEVIVTAQHKDAVIQINGNEAGRGLYRQMLLPGPVAVRVIHGGKEHQIEISVAAGGRYAVMQNSDGELESNATAPLRDPNGDDFKPDLPEVLRGIYGTGTAAFLTAFTSVKDFEVHNDDRFGAAVGLHVGYRVADWAGFEVMGQYSDIRVSGDVTFQSDDVTFVLRTVRTGILLRAMFPGRHWIRFLGTAGGGAVIEWLEWRGASQTQGIFIDTSGVGPFGEIDLGVEMELSNVLIGVVIQNAVQGTKHFDLSNDQNAFETKPIFVFGPSIRIGYGIW